ncbi:glycosyltransferase family 2 protein [Methylomonas sp. LW13]|uniref:glycosyltransferase n=1 Tax=unclassified Methylomonas TaxID=2608980 RepID=UPI00051ABAE6|nr:MULTISPECIES: glycosyltransferase [unclassified Methylomonas]PKD42123.1 glycosyltransferase family 2 protein [Methylomonas sp. Kb3]QBC26901.1 glycosyltransferase family 2 protein [Methylomonas sp. LW13]
MSLEKASKKLTFAFCTYNRAERLENLVFAMRAQSCPIPFEILAVNNNSSDATSDVLKQLQQLPGPTLRWVHEPNQGIVAARNRAIQEAINSDILVFIDDDELPLTGLLETVTHAYFSEGAECVGGRIDIDFTHHKRPEWLDDELLGFLGALDHGKQAFWIEDSTTPVWAGNIAYDMAIFRNDPALRFDRRYDRKGKTIGGGEDVMMFNVLLQQKRRIRYRPDMAILHAVEPWRLRRRYFLDVHFLAGYRGAINDFPVYHRTYLGIPPFLISQIVRQTWQWLALAFTAKHSLRQAMNVSYSLGQICGCFSRWKNKLLINN